MQKDITNEILTHSLFHNNSRSNIRYHFWSNTPTSVHRHDHYEFFVVTENKLIHQFNGKIRLLEKGTLSLSRPNDVHQLRKYRNEPNEHFNLAVSKTLFENLCSIVNPNLLEWIQQQTNMFSYTLQPAEYDYFLHIIHKAQVIPEQVHQDFHPAFMRLLAHTFLTHFNTQQQEATAKSHSELPWLTIFLNKLSTPEIFRLPLTEIYRLSGYSQPRLNTLFHKHVGTTLINYLTQQKIQYACNLLKTTNYKIITISEMTGFNSICRFNFAFKSITGLTPTQYRDKYTHLSPKKPSSPTT
jgi:AraC-like DNA-binding protein